MDYDLVVIGGGIHGVGTAQAAAAQGHRVLLLEKEHLAAGTSSRSSKLIHGGLRYLEAFRLSLVRECLRERTLLLRNAPDLVKLAPFLIPVYRATSRRPWKIRVGLTLYALLSGLHSESRFVTLQRCEWSGLDGLRTDGLLRVFRYFDAQTDDAALTRAVMRSATKLGAHLACPATFLGAQRHPGGYRVRYAHEEAIEERSCHTLINAAGPWIPQVLEQIEPAPPPCPIELAQGTHILVPGTLRRGIYYTESPVDRRAVFFMPWEGNTLVGTTETPYRGDPDDVQPLPQEVDYLLTTLRHYFPERGDEVLASFAGLRVLPRGSGSISRRSRETRLIGDDPRRPHLVTIAGGKLTSYRSTAERALAMLAPALPTAHPIANTAELALHPDKSKPAARS